MIRLWLLPTSPPAIFTGPELAKLDVHPLRCIYLGRFSSPDDPAAIELAKAKIKPPELVMAHNIRIACDRRQTKRWRLSEQEIDLLRSGQRLTIQDGLGRFTVGYSKPD